jgi:hypothetical protein
MCGKVGKLKWAGNEIGEAIVVTVPMTIGGKDIFHIEAQGVGVTSRTPLKFGDVPAQSILTGIRRTR